MGVKGPAKLYPHILEVALTDEQACLVSETAAVTRQPRSAVVRAMVDNELSEYVARVHELRKAAGQ